MNNKKKILILSTVNIMHMTLISLYTNIFDKNNYEYDIIYMDKYNIEEKFNSKNTFRFTVKNRKTIAGKVFNILKFKKYAKKILKRNQYDLVVVWNELTMTLFNKILRNSYKNKYILNIRDYGFNDKIIIKNITKHTIEKSIFTMISSEGYLDFLPKSNKYMFVHSFNNNIFNEKYEYEKKNTGKINILFIGKLSYYESSLNFINALANNSQINLIFVGAGCNRLIPYIKEHNIRNVTIKDAFDPNQTLSYLKKADIIFNLYNQGTVAEDTAISIKFYYSIKLNIPILTYKNTYMDELASDLGLSITIENPNYNKDIANLILNKYQEWDQKKSKIKSFEFMEKIERSHSNFEIKLMELLLDE